MKPQFETSAKGQSKRTNRLFFVIQSSCRHTSSHGNQNPRQRTGKSPFFIESHSIGLDYCQGNRVAWRQTKTARNSLLRFDATTPATTASCLSPSTVLTSQISGSEWRERTCSLFCICAVHSFTLIVVFTTLSFGFILLSVITPRFADLFVRTVWRRCTQGGEVQQRRLRTSCCPTSDTGHDNEASSFPETKNGLVFLCRCPASGAVFGWQTPSQCRLQWCWRVGAVSNFPLIYLDTTHASPNRVMLLPYIWIMGIYLPYTFITFRFMPS